MNIKIGNRTIKLNERPTRIERAVAALRINRNEINDGEIKRVASIYDVPVADIKSRL
ncbi:unnamed protein product [marine sediment metagenome]|uniref:HTH psq-type domain-containing protein n=1 Tax=marine sediment metagenome TaxID=412755 RepID=X0SPI8_9ZZZZ